jgi:dTMP kinase|tara:strand:- start:243 stop:869 length:627 start_codon:yes stop_codon:yes gene_type:complete
MASQFITFEGGEGSGKSSQINILKSKLIDKGIDVVCTREPGGTPSAEILRELVTTGEVNKWEPMTEALLMFASRYEHTKNLIIPSLENGKWVLCDRFYHSTYAYQGLGHGLGLEAMEALKKISIGEIEPDLVFFLDIDPMEGIKRTMGRHTNEDRFEKMDISFHTKLRNAFLGFSKTYSENSVVINASQEINKISDIIFEEIEKRFKI